jgi:hypothetical protein
MGKATPVDAQGKGLNMANATAPFCAELPIAVLTTTVPELA